MCKQTKLLPAEKRESCGHNAVEDGNLCLPFGFRSRVPNILPLK